MRTCYVPYLGRRIRVAVVAVCCDHPAMCKMCGFGDHRKEDGFCPRCHMKHADLRTEAAMSENSEWYPIQLYFIFIQCASAFPPRTGEQHRAHAAEYAHQEDDAAREDYFKMHSARYFELSRLPYFDPVRMTVIDPMHNILLGEIVCSGIV